MNAVLNSTLYFLPALALDVDDADDDDDVDDDDELPHALATRARAKQQRTTNLFKANPSSVFFVPAGQGCSV
jgi:hypothetical protein